ncbi:MAG TPA: C10 family peptidase [Bacteroidia bacterium]|jgi:PKD repeat protein|nr:C10 family peptidase [Bacteroidia bacterium]
MKKLTAFLLAIMVCIGTSNAGVVPQSTAQTVATNFYTQNFAVSVNSISLAYSEPDANGTVAYYVFNVNDNGGFVIVSAEDAGHPIIGCSNTGKYGIPTGTNNELDFWMKKRNAEITQMRIANIQADAEVNDEWHSYVNNTIPQSVKKNQAAHKALASQFPSSTAYLVKSTWDQQYQPYPYNYFCPPGTKGAISGNSVTGCVATTMAQIMRYWSYPPKGIGSSSYCDCTASGFTKQYGTLSADYATTNYNWSAMPLTPAGTASVNTGDTDIARLMYDCGVSVQMDYSPTGSGSFVVTLDDPNNCAQISYPKYFGYNSKIIDGLRANSNATTWQDTIENDLNKNRPVQYYGTDPKNGGHTWVCDGYNSSNQFHMNWGWSGTSNGWYALSNLAPTGQPDDFTTNLGALIGIQPPPQTPLADFTANVTTIPVGGSVNFYDLSVQFPTSWAWTFTGAATTSSTAENPTGIVYNTAGTYQVTLKVTNAAGNNTMTKTSYITVVSGQGCDTLSNLPDSATLEVYGSPTSGWLDGCYGDTVQQVAEYFQYPPSSGFTMGSAYVYFYKASSTTKGRTVNVNVWDNTGTGGAPGKILATKAVAVSTINPANGAALITFTTPVAVTTPYYVGVDFTTIAAAYKTDTIAIVTDTNNDQGAPATAWQYIVAAKYGFNGWSPLASFWGDNLSNAIWPVFCDGKAPTGFYDVDLSEGVKLYPNPTKGTVTAEVNLEQSSNVQVQVFNALGQMVQQSHWDNVSNATYTIDLSAQANGMYFVKLTSDKATITKKIMLNR